VATVAAVDMARLVEAEVEATTSEVRLHHPAKYFN
jgi:hypothetical protein